jgi:MSHA pilin protein MshC
VELVTVIVIIGAVGAMVVPRWFDNQVFEQRGYVEDLASAIRHSQRIAVASSCQVQVNITANGYSARQRAALNTCNTAGPWTQLVARQAGTGVIATAPSGVVTNPAATLVFEPDGSIPAGAPPVLTIGAFTLSIDAASGVVTVQP